MSDPRQIAAILMGCTEESLRGVRQLEGGAIVAIAPDGRKLVFSAEAIADVQRRLTASLVTTPAGQRLKRRPAAQGEAKK